MPGHVLGAPICVCVGNGNAFNQEPMELLIIVVEVLGFGAEDLLNRGLNFIGWDLRVEPNQGRGEAIY